MALKLKKYGWRPDLPDKRDYKFQAPKICALSNLVDFFTRKRNRIDFRSLMPPVIDQQTLGSCTACAGGAAFQYELTRQGVPNYIASRLFIYYNSRLIENSVNDDSGATIRDTIKSLVQNGACLESEWPYDISRFTIKPAEKCYIDAEKRQALRYNRLSTIYDMKACLKLGFPFVFGFSLYESFESDAVAANGIVPMPSDKEELLGGHATVAVGFDDYNKWFICRNSWGPNWGEKGYFYMKYEYLTNRDLSDDFWVIFKIE